MKNKEKFAKEIIEIACAGDKLAMRKDNNCLTACIKTRCRDCCFFEDGGCSKLIQEWAESEYVEKPVISKGDRVFLNYLKGYKYIARDNGGGLYAYKSKPIKGDGLWGDAVCKSLTRLDIDFPMVKQSDNKPWLIDDLKKLEVCDEQNQ